MTRVVFSLSSSYSGSTLLSFLLNAHPQIVTVSETDPMEHIKNNPNFMCSCGTPIRHCEFFHQVREGMKQRGLEFAVEDMDLMLNVSRNPRWNELLTGRIPYVQSSRAETVRDWIADLIPGVRRKKRIAIERNEAFIRTLADLTHADVYVDANKNAYRMRFFQKYFPVSAIYLFKNGVAGVHSYMKRRHRSPGLHVEAAAHRWFKEQLTISRALLLLPERDVIQVPYSEMCADVEGTLGRIFRMIGVREHKIGHPNDVAHHIIGNAMRLRPIAEIADRETWRAEMTEAEIAVYQRVYRRYIDRVRRVNPFLAEHIWH
jgi:hypothetical protein